MSDGGLRGKVGIHCGRKEEEMRSLQESIVRTAVLAGFGILMLAAAPLRAAEAEYPIRPITINVGMAPGAGTSVLAQLLAESVKKYLAKPQPVIVNYKPGASGMVCADYVMKQPADGYNVLLTAPDIHLRMAMEPQKFSFTLKDFSFIRTVAYAPVALAVSNDSPFKTLEDFVAYGKKHPGEMTNSLSGIGTGGHVTLEIFCREAGIKVTHAPFASGAAAILAMLGGHVTCVAISTGSLGAHIRPGGKARALVVFDVKRHPDLPEVPTCKERGYNVVRDVFFYIYARKGTPKPVLDTLSNLFKQTADDPDVRSGVLKGGMLPLNLGPEETEKKVFEDFEVARDIFGKLGLAGK